MRDESCNRRSTFARKMLRKFERKLGKNRLQRPMAEKVRKYEARGTGYEFIPAIMHLVRRYFARLPDEARNEVDNRLAKALEELPDARAHLAAALNQHDKISNEVKRRAFSPKYLGLRIDQGIDGAEMEGIVQRANVLQNSSVRFIHSNAALLTKDAESCCCHCSTNPSGDPDSGSTAPPNKYEVSFTKLYCVDESDPEWLGSDEPYVVFGIITEEMAEAGTAAQAVHTPVYEGVDDGDTRPESGDENLRLFGFTGPRAIDSSVLITAACFENDLGDPAETTSKVRTALTAVATAAAGAGGVAGWIVAGVAVVGIGVTYLVDLIGADDSIGGTNALSLTEAEADARTASVNPALFAPLHFDGGDDDGIYDVYLKLNRV